MEERERRPFLDFDDFMTRVGPDEREVRALINAGAFGSLQEDRDQAVLFWQLARQKQTAAASKSSAAAPALFSAQESTPPPSLPQGREIERLRRQFNVLGFLPDRHPMTLFAQTLKGKGLIKAVDLDRYVGRRAGLAGWLITAKTVRSKRDQAMQFTTLRTRPDWSRRPSSPRFSDATT